MKVFCPGHAENVRLSLGKLQVKLASLRCQNWFVQTKKVEKEAAFAPKVSIDIFRSVFDREQFQKNYATRILTRVL